MARTLLLFGLALIALGVLLELAPGALHWFGRLPGDIRVQNERSAFFFPLTSMVIVSIVATLLLNILGRFFK